MRGQADGAHPRIVDEAARDHEPSDRALQAAQQEDSREPPRERPANRAAREKIKEGNEERHADHAAQEPVAVLPPVDALEVLERHVEVALAPFGGELVLVELGLPLGIVQRRDRADHGLPFDDREARMGEARDPAHHDHGEDERAAGEKPGRDGTVVIGRSRAVHPSPAFCQTRAGYLNEYLKMIPLRRHETLSGWNPSIFGMYSRAPL